jgi:O-antigen/teichoic acid export membrane protein
LTRHAFVELLRRGGVNRPAFYAMLTRGMQGAAALISILLVGRLLDRTAQGYYFTILGLVAFVQLAEFGLTYAVMQSASHEAATSPSERERTPSSTADGRLAALLHGATRFNTATTILAAVSIAVVGTRMLTTAEPTSTGGRLTWAAPWIAALFAVATSQLLNPRISLLEGAGFVSDVWRLRFLAEIAAAVALWTALLAGLGLWAIPVSYAVRAGTGLIWLGRGWPRRYFRALAGAGVGTENSVYWRSEVWPFQWRIGVSALSGYLIFQFFTPLMFALEGPTTAGQFGMTLTLTNGLLTVTTAWLNSQAPLFGRLIAAQSYGRLHHEFVRSLRSSLLVVLCLGAGLSVGVFALDHLHHPLAQRLLPPGTFVLFIAATVTNHVVFAMAVYLRAHRREPLMATSVAGAVVTPLAVSYAARHGGVTAIAATYLALTLLGLAITAVIFTSRSRAWRVDSYA